MIRGNSFLISDNSFQQIGKMSNPINKIRTSKRKLPIILGVVLALAICFVGISFLIDKSYKTDKLTEDDVEFLEDFGGKEKLEFLKSLSVLSVPERKRVAYGLYVVEAMAAGVPVVQPRSGVFVELLEMTGGGILFEPGDDSDKMRAIEQ